MPTYQYECSSCGYSFEVFQSMTDKKKRKCPACAKMQLSRLVGSGSSIIFKGSGFYETDYKSCASHSGKDSNNAAKQSAADGSSCGDCCCGCPSSK